MIMMAISLLVWIAAIGCGVMAGVYFAFSAFIMMAFARIDEAHGIAAMTAINRVILSSLFMPLFWGTTVGSLVLAVLGPLCWSKPGSVAILAGSLVYLVGMFLVTIAFNVPRNNALARADEEQAAVWTEYLVEWTRWNHVRTAASAVAAVLFIIALAVE